MLIFCSVSTVIILQCSFLLASSSLDREENKIVGGIKVDISKHPYVLQFNLYDRPVCGACLIGDRYAVTAAHCAIISEDNAGMSIRAGTSRLNRGGVLIGIKNRYIFPLYRPPIHNYDMAILELSTPLNFTQNIQPIKLPPGPIFIPVGTPADIMGWGYVNENSKIQSFYLRDAAVRISDIKKCNERYFGSIDPISMFCAGDAVRDTCQGDSGGPLVIDGVLIGIVSFGIGCGEVFYPGVYTNVPNLRWFIKSVTNL